MTGREKIEAALSTGGSRETPVVICYEGIYVRDHWDELTSCPWWYAFSDELDHQLAWRRDAIARTGQDWFALPVSRSRADRAASAIRTGPDGVSKIDRVTRQQTALHRPEIGGWNRRDKAAYVRRPLLPASAEEVDAAIPPPELFDAEAFVADGRGDLATALLTEFGRQLMPLCHISSPLWGCYGIWGFEGMMRLVGERPELIERSCRRLLAHRLREVRQAAALGAGAIWIEECLTDLVSPAAFERLNVPFLRRLVEDIRAAGMKSIYYYCGDPSSRWGLLESVGADALSLEESKKGFAIDIEDVVHRFRGEPPAPALLGNLDAIGLLPTADEARLRAEIARQIVAGQRHGGRFIMSLGSPVTPGTSVGRVRQYCDLVHDLGG